MSRSIKVDDQVYHLLCEIQEKGETFSDVVARLIRVYRIISNVFDHPAPGYTPHRRRVFDAAAKEILDG